MAAYQITVSRLRRYPVKGFKGHDLDRTALEAGAGIPFDRSLALVTVPTGDVAARDRGTLPYFYLSRNPPLARYRLDWDGDGRFRFISPSGESAAFDAATGSPDAANAALTRWFGERPGGAPLLAPVRRDGGYWDFSDSALSIINLATVRDIARSAGREIDPMRFRANLYIDGLPAWREFDLVGWTMAVGEARLEVLRGIARCNATSIDPITDDVDMNMPVHLRATYGHLFCGVYARVAKGGGIGLGDALTIDGAYAGDPYDIRASTSRPPREWPRFVRVSERSGRRVGLASTRPGWPLLAVKGEAELHLHPTEGGTRPGKARLVEGSSAEHQWIDDPGQALSKGAELLVSGPFPIKELGVTTAAEATAGQLR